jgi:hypothetical protein
MIRKFVTLTLLATITLNFAFAQGRDYRRERAELARQEKEEKRQMRAERMSAPSGGYGTNILRLSPITAMDIGVGFGLSYEKIFGKDQMIGLILPVYLMLESQNDYDPFFGGSGGYNNGNNAYVYFNPGLKIYPFGQRRVTYAVGPSLMFGYGGGTEWIYSGNGNVYEQSDITKLRMGMLVNNYVNFQITSGFNLGIEAGIGARYIDRETIDRAGYNYGSQTYNNGINVTGSFSLTLGYRF